MHIKKIGAVVLVLGALSGCAKFEPKAEPLPESGQVVTVLVRPNSFEQAVLGELYKQILVMDGRRAQVTADISGESPLHSLLAETGDVYISCASELLRQNDPNTARDLEQEFAKTKDGRTPVEWAEIREDTYKAVVASLGNGLSATDPSNALGCPGDNSDLAHNLVPIYRTPVLSRRDRISLNKVSGSISTAELEELVTRARQGENTSDMVTEFLSTKTL